MAKNGLGGTESDFGKQSESASKVNKVTKKGFDVKSGPGGLGDSFRKLAEARNATKVKTHSTGTY